MQWLDNKAHLDSFIRDIESLRIENDRYRGKCEELEKWVILLTNSFYEGKTHSLETMDWALKGLEIKSLEAYQAKVALVNEKRRN